MLVRIHERPVDAVVVGRAAHRVLEERRDKIEAGLNRDDVAGLERQIHAQRAERRPGIFGATGEEAAAVAHAEADHVPEAVGEKKRVSFLFDERSRRAAHDAHGDEARDHFDGAGEVNVGPLSASDAATDRAFLGVEDDLIEVALKWVRLTDDVGAGDIGGVATDRSPGVHEDKITAARPARRGRKWRTAELEPVPTMVP